MLSIAICSSRSGGSSQAFAVGVSPSTKNDHLSGKKILLVEDEVFIAFDVQHALEAAGASVVYARTLAQALRATAEEQFDAAVLDVTLDANQTCQPVADRLHATATPFILHSGDLDRQGEVIAMLGAPVVRKPSQPEDVVRSLIRVLDRGGGAQH